MPTVKNTRKLKYQKIQQLIMGRGIDATALSGILGCCYVTAQKRLKQPELFTLADLHRINQRTDITMDEFREALVI